MQHVTMRVGSMRTRPLQHPQTSFRVVSRKHLGGAASHLVFCSKKDTKDEKKLQIVENAKERMKKRGIDKATAQTILRVWREKGVDGDPKQLRKVGCLLSVQLMIHTYPSSVYTSHLCTRPPQHSFWWTTQCAMSPRSSSSSALMLLPLDGLFSAPRKSAKHQKWDGYSFHWNLCWRLLGFILQLAHCSTSPPSGMGSCCGGDDVGGMMWV